MTRTRWIVAGLATTVILATAAVLYWSGGDAVAGTEGAAAPWGAALIAALTVLLVVAGRIVERSSGKRRPSAARHPVPAETTEPTQTVDGSQATANAVTGGVSGSTLIQGGTLTFHQPTHHTVIDTQVVHAPEPEPAWPMVVGVLPNEADHFQHRSLTDRLTRSSRDHPTVVLGQVLSGMGGVGKTQLAAHHARALLRREEVDLVVWAPAAERATILRAYADAAHRILHSPADEDPEHAARRFLTWLQTTDQRWLVVLDNLDVPEHVRGLWPTTSAPAAADTAGPRGRLVVTTRRTDTALAGRGRAFIDVGVYTPDESLTYLATALDDLPLAPDQADLTALAEDLGHLPLALSHAAAYIRDRRGGMTCASYRALFRDRRGALDRLFPEEESLPDDYARTVATTWAVSVEHANTLTPRGLALPMMRLVSLLDPTGIPVAALTSSPVLDHLRRARPEEPGPTSRDADDALSALARLHLVTRSGFGDDALVGAHRLVQRATRERRATRPDRDTVRAAADALLSVWEPSVHATGLGQRLRSNTTALAEHERGWLWDGGAHPLLVRLGQSLGKAGALSQAVAHCEELADTADARLGAEHPDTLAARHDILLWRGLSGEVRHAAEGFGALAGTMTRVLGARHPQTLRSRVQAARWRSRAGDPRGAVADFEDIVPVQTRVLGADHPDVLSTRAHLASARGRAGDAEGAVESFRAVLADELPLLGAEHPSAMVTRNQVARWLGRAGDPRGAIRDLEALLPDQLRVLGPDHPDTLTTRGQIAAWKGVVGEYAEAVAELEAHLADQLRALGPDHPHVFTTRNSLARFRGEAGDPARAVEELTALLPDQIRVMGPDHPKTREVEEHLEAWRRRAER
ncbi:tetratricopeptide repeat protein [Nocardiopsis sp. EMB25]|uniref:tetratricopeptide repeat protein n=1 Tax=Nocardiopsis sp. EMB25 TaxID=2835867 RepID=UPI0022842E93|nr:tetratricopeptide repeat protein [Nocardiopsis sp. EMB25]MCY9784233.1 tetratricopeptide repeat protein [Nocardiopsis sp. EMB25]